MIAVVRIRELWLAMVRVIAAAPADVNLDVRHAEALLKAGALQSAIFNSANFSSIATDAKGVIQIFNVGAERMLGYTAVEVMNKITPAEISDPQVVIARAKALSVELGTPITPGFEVLVFKASRGIEDIYELTYIRKDGSRFGLGGCRLECHHHRIGDEVADRFVLADDILHVHGAPKPERQWRSFGVAREETGEFE